MAVTEYTHLPISEVKGQCHFQKYRQSSPSSSSLRHVKRTKLQKTTSCFISFLMIYLVLDLTSALLKRSPIFSRFMDPIIIDSSLFPYHLQSHNGNTISYDGEKISWKTCGDIKNHTLECSSIFVPMDQFNSANSGNKTFEIPLIRLRGHDAGHGKNLLVNPGGPGASGIEFIYRRGEQLNTIIGEGFHLVSFDPRGINSSQPQASCYSDQDSRQRLSPLSHKHIIKDSGEIIAQTDNFAQACADTMQEHGKYINTPQTAADMNNVLDALGQKNMTYWGFSYGTILGQTYATMFPERSDKVIIDGVANIFDWYESKLDEEMWTDTDAVFEGFFEECIKAGKSCALAELASTKEELQEKMVELGKKLKDEPLNVYINSTQYGILDFETILFKAFFPALYKPSNWHDLAKAMASLMKGNGTQAFLNYGIDDSFNMAGEGHEFVLLNDGVTGEEYWPRNRKALLGEILGLFNRSIFAVTDNDTFYQKARWLIPKTHSFKPQKQVKTARPLLILSTTYDPVCPLKSAKVARDTFADSRVVEVMGYGHCSVAVPSWCLAEHVRDYLYDGELPSQGDVVKCEVDEPYFLPPENQTSYALINFGDQWERMNVHLAQVKMAEEMEWGMLRF